MYVPIRTTSARYRPSRLSFRSGGLVFGVLCLLSALPLRLRAEAYPPAEGSDKTDVIARYRDAVAKSPTADNHAALAWVLSRYASNNAEALRHAEEALKLDAEHFKAHEIAVIASEMLGREREILHHLLAMMRQDRPEVRYYLEGIGRLRLSVPERRRAIRALKEFVGLPGRPLHRATARWVLGRLLVSEGRLDEARRVFEGLRYMRTWRVIGPFDNEANGGFGMSYGPEKEIDFAKSYRGRGPKVSWRKLEHTTLAGLCNFHAVMYPNDQVLAYAVTFVRAPRRTNAVARLAVEQSAKLWVNGRLVLADDQDKGLALDPYAVPIVLEQGWNRILVKVCRHESQWRFGLRLTDPSGAPLEGLEYSDDPHPIRTATTAPAPEFDYAGGMLTHFDRLVAKDRKSETSVYYLGLAQSMVRRLAPAARSFEWLVSLNRHCSEYRLRLALAYWADDKPDKAFEQLKTASELEPNNLSAHLLIGRFYTARDSLEKALETLNRAVEIAPDFVDAHLALQKVYLEKGWSYPAYTKAKKLQEAHPQISTLTSGFAARCRAFGYRDEAKRLFEQAVKQDAANVSARRALIAIDIREDRVDAALKRCEVLQEMAPLDHAVRMQRVDLLLREKRFAPAIALCREGLAICPTHASYHEKLGQIYERMGKMDEALDSWRTALKYKPDDQDLRDYLDFLRPEQESVVFEKFGISDAEAAEIIEEANVGESTHPKADAVVLLSHRVTRLFEDGSSSSQEHGICKVLNERGRRKYSKISMKGENLKVLRAVVIKPDGTEVEATELAGGGIHFAQLQPGSTLEYKVAYHRSRTSWLSRHFSYVAKFQSSDPSLRRQWTLVAPKDRTVRFVVQGERIKQTRSEFRGKAVYDFRADDVPMLEPEAARPPPVDIIELVRASTIKDWGEIARWEWALVKDQIEVDSAIRRKVKGLTAGCRTREDRIRAVYNFVAQKIQYKVLHRSSIFGIKPQKAPNVLANEWGECKGKAVLLIAMLKELGIEACYVTLRTRNAGTFVREIPSNQCTHAIVYVPDPDDFEHGIWLDATAEYHNVHSLPWADCGVEAMVFQPNGTLVFQTIPQVAPDKNRIRMKVAATLEKDGSAQARATWIGTGEYAAGIRRQFRQIGRRKQQLEAVVTSLHAGSRLSDMSFSDLTDRDGPAEVRFDFQSRRYAEVADSRLIVQPKRKFDLTKRYAPRTERYYDVWLAMPSTVEYTEVYQFPRTWDVVSVPEAATLDTPWMRYEIAYTVDAGGVRVDKRFAIKETSVPKAEYERLRSFCISVDQQEQKTITLEPK